MNLFDTLDLSVILKISIYIIVGTIVYNLIKFGVKRINFNNGVIKKHRTRKRAETFRAVMLNLVKYIIILIVLIAVLSALGINVKTLVAGLGISAVLLGLALQDIAKDFLSGVSIVTEDQYEIGDFVEINGFKGKVTFVGLRTTRIRNEQGAVKIIGNSKIVDVINYNLSNAVATIDVKVSLENNPEKVESILNAMAIDLKGKIEKVKGNIKVLGIEEIKNDGLVYRITAETDTTSQDHIQRILRREVVKALTKAKIKM